MRSIKSQAVRAWNEINVDLHDLQLQNCSKAVCKDRIFKYLIEKYDGNNIDININNMNNNPNNRRNNNNNNNHNGIQVLRHGRNNYGRLGNWTGERMVRW